jgi:TRAP-type C4-dicarboxylate transport system substrate-binding protein
MFRSQLAAFALASATTAFLAGSAAAFDVKFATYVPPAHGVAKFFETTLKDIAARSNGGITLTYLPGAQLGPPPKYYDMAKSGQADITWFLHGNTPGVFPLTEIGTVPLLMGSAEIGTKVLNDPALRDKYLAKEHVGVHIINLHTHQPANVYTARKAIRTVDDFKRMRLRVASGPVRDLAIALGATPDGMPATEWVEGLQKGTIDGVFTDYGGAGIAFRIGPVVKFGTELYFYVGTFCLCINERTYGRLPANVRKDLDDTFSAKMPQSGIEFDKLDDIGKRVMMGEGMQPVTMPPEELRKFRTVVEKVANEAVETTQKKGVPAHEVYALMKSLSEKHAKTSRNFWTH